MEGNKASVIKCISCIVQQDRCWPHVAIEHIVV